MNKSLYPLYKILQIYTYIITYTDHDYFNAFFRNFENKENLYENFTCQGIIYVIILLEAAVINYDEKLVEQ